MAIRNSRSQDSEDQETSEQNGAKSYHPGFYNSSTSPYSSSYDSEGQSSASKKSRGNNSNTSDLDDVRHSEAGGDDFKYNPDGDQAGSADAPGVTSETGKSPSPSELNDAEGQADDQFASGFDKPYTSRRRRVKNFVSNNRNKLIPFSVVFTGAIMALIIGLISLIPLKIENMVQNLQDKFFSAPQQAVESASRKIAQNYIIKYVIPDYKSCGTTLDRRCKVRVSATQGNPVHNLYRAWSNQRLETKLAEKYGLEFRYNKYSGLVYAFYPNGPPGGVDIGRDGQRLGAVLDNPARKDMLRVLDRGLEGETKFTRVYYRYKVGPLLRNKFGIKRCIFFCGTRRAINGTKDDLKRSAKLIVAERVLKPRSETGYLAVVCVLDPSCQPQVTQPELCGQGAADCTPQPPVSDFEVQQRQLLEKLATQYGVSDINKLVRVHGEVSERGFQRYMTDQLLQRVFKSASEESIKKATDTIPIIGWINLAAEIVNLAHDAGPKIKKLTYATNAAAAVSLYMTYRTYADEIHTGEADPNQLGSMVNSLGTGVEDPNDPLVGGTANAEESPVYSAIMQDAPIPSDKVSPEYKCDNGKSPKPGDICSEERLGQGIGALNSISQFLEEPGANIITTIAQVWSSTIGAIFNFVGDAGGEVISTAAKPVIFALNTGCSVKIPVPFTPDFYPADRIVPGYCNIRATVQDAAPLIADTIANKLIPNPFGSNMGGGRNLTMMAGGAAAAANASCEQMGCENVSDSVAMDIVNSREREARQEFAKQPLKDRLFSKDSKYSLISQTAVAMPMSIRGSAQSTMASLTSSPLAIISRTLGAALPFMKASAAATPADQCKIIGIDCMAFPENKMPDDFEKYWDEQNCGDNSDNGPIARWQKAAAATDPSKSRTGTPMRDDVEPCLLIKQAVGAAGGLFDKGLLDKGDLTEFDGGQQAAPTEAPDKLNEADLFKDSSNIQCASGSKDLGVHDAYRGGQLFKARLCALSDLPSSSEASTPGNSLYIQGANGKAIVNSRVSKNFVALVKAAKSDDIPMKAMSSYRSMKQQEQLCRDDAGCSSGNYTAVAKPGTSNHQAGVAIDFAMADQAKYSLDTGNCVTKNGVCEAPGDKVWEWLQDNASKYGLKQYVNEFWHWSPNGQ